ncbi:hypothetical protein EMIHUDRAFT_196118 [Emiliania huxleyi CCMP1516]|uniref:Apple domain-containing protein n=2 Tax=Emiliania huxleyi TaxID=2903 RepID=A0A0D3J3I7_EMIH1|nr:hypothetical protein EMIHUDRAFT_196118 [Emiliania huxleyi CCMP1516]EOD18072.1 hypothetical protein EMIHUDRAFT_196118 [Emiliania huxleyi CCMP1516]|eukprot:XP_005770501.1 hypothetical protein EMIHUDRAFT_196118 [Emiliania huxleyi CCMP1516]
MLGAGWDAVSITSAEHVEWLVNQATAAGVDLSLFKGVPLAYDPHRDGRTYFDLTNLARDVTPILTALQADGWPGDFHTQQNRFCNGTGQPYAGFGYKPLPKPGIVDFGICQPFHKVICELKARPPPQPRAPPLLPTLLLPEFKARWCSSATALMSTFDSRCSEREFCTSSICQGTEPPLFPDVHLIDPSADTHLLSIRSSCQMLGAGWDAVSITSAEHVEWLVNQATAAGVDLSLFKGVPLAYDPHRDGRTYFDLTNLARDVTPILTALQADGWPGDFHTRQNRFCNGTGQPYAGFGYKPLPKPGIVDFGICQPFHKVICELKARPPPQPRAPPLLPTLLLPWSSKCGWDDCAGCSHCFLPPRIPSPGLPPMMPSIAPWDPPLALAPLPPAPLPSPKVCVVPVSFGVRRYCSKPHLSHGFVDDEAACRRECEEDEACLYYSFWTSNWCRLTPACDDLWLDKDPSLAHTTITARLSDGFVDGEATCQRLCEAEEACLAYSFWTSRWCRLSPICDELWLDTDPSLAHTTITVKSCTPPAPAAPAAPSEESLCKPFCSRHSAFWMQKCWWNDCKFCEDCGSGQPAAESSSCKPFCSGHTAAWPEKCMWKDCGLCPGCGSALRR